MTIFRNYLKDPLSTIAINTTLLIFGIIFFVLFGFTMVMIEETQENPIRQEHLKQHDDDQVKYDQMINLLDSINNKLDD